MTKIKIKELKKYIGQEIEIRGFVYNVREQGSIVFLIIRDISGTVQCVATKSNEEVFKKIKKITLESSIELKGIVKEENKVFQGFEVEIFSLNVISKCENALPIPVYEKSGQTTFGICLEHRFLDLRKPKNALIIKLSSAFDNYYREFLTKKGFLEIHTPKLMATPSESSSDLFEVKYFDRAAYLAQSPQLYKQMAIASGLEKVFEIGPIFRAEKSFTTRHATECTCYDIEMSYIKSHEDIMKLEERLITYIITKIKKNFGEEIKQLYNIDISIPKLPFPRITMAEAKYILGSKNLESDLSSEEEKTIGEYFLKKGQEFVFITDFPISVRPFYHKRHKNKSTTKSADLLYKGLEITTLAQREENYETLTAQLKEKGIGQTELQWYLDFFKYGTPPHGGWGFGGARFIMKMLELKSIKEAMYIYRGVNHINP